LTILGDNAVARSGVKAVWGFACLVEARGHTVLFDTGADPAVLKDNLTALKVDPARIEAVVISHYHGDHTWGAPGLGKLAGVRVFTPHSFEGHPEEAAALRSAGLVLTPVSQTTPLFEGMTISEPLHFAGRIRLPGPGHGFTDELWEQCLTVDTPDGLVVIVGCSHPGILPMLEQVKRQTSRPVCFVMGGFHLLGQPEAEVSRIATAMKAMGVAYVSATHCTGEAAAYAFRDIFRDRYVAAGVGAVINLPVVPTATGSSPQPNKWPLDPR
jgi:7,8-dihydropterin-6-yl-methyl-4-(beta-D-ribofuranosyl)aminobenzene 5'-phosphate synthase